MLVQTKYGSLQGVRENGHWVFKGVPYAKPPVGALRWKAPEPPQPWEGVLTADRFRARCPQTARQPGSFYDREFGDPATSAVPLSEDCLYLNLWVPEHTPEEKLPVAVWIHGGAFLTGCGFEKQFDGKAMADRGVILVTINYRLGVWGFLAHPWLREESGVSGNYGILDQIAALKWVQENIAAFGGDKDNVTVFGQSAGAMSVLTLISSELSRGLFARAIVQSGLGLESGRPLEQAEEDGLAFSQAAGAENLEQLRRLPTEQVSRLEGPLIAKGFQSGGGLTFSPVVDGYVLKEGYHELWRQGKMHPVPYLIGCNREDMRSDPQALARGEQGGMYHAMEDFARQACPNTPVYAYYFTRQMPGDNSGAFHSAELWYVFGTMDRAWRPWTPEDHRLCDQILSCWTRFMKTGNPNENGQESWPAYTLEAPHIQILDVKSGT